MAKRRQTFERAARKRKAAQRAKAAKKLRQKKTDQAPESKVSSPSTKRRA
jgi:hypothetical protein